MSKSLDHFYTLELLYEIGQDFLDIQYVIDLNFVLVMSVFNVVANVVANINNNQNNNNNNNNNLQINKISTQNTQVVGRLWSLT